MKRHIVAIAAAALALPAGFGVWRMLSPVEQIQVPPPAAPAPLGDMLAGGPGQDFEQALKVRRLEFPQDHGPHPKFQTEWWYFTGNLKAGDQRRFGYQFTVFRRAASNSAPELDSHWATNQIYLAHIGLTDIEGSEYLTDEKYSRDSLDLAGARAQPFAAWVENWIAAGSEGECGGCLDLSIKAQSEEFSIDLVLTSAKPAVLHGDRGLSRKGDGRGNASYYYSLTRMNTSGTVSVRGQSMQVSGDSWMDHEWFSSVLGPDDAGWDWFSLQLDDGREIMVFQIRRHNGAADPFKYGAVIDTGGAPAVLRPEQFRMIPLRMWQSEQSGAQYPVHWRLEIAQPDMRLEIEAAIDAQERADSFRYWEGAVSVRGVDGATPVQGAGYLEMTGYRQ